MKPDDFQNLIDRCLDGLADDAEIGQLLSLIRHDAALRQQYVANCRLREVLASRLSESSDGELVLVDAAYRQRPRSRFVRNALAVALAAAAGFLLAATQWRPANDTDRALRQGDLAEAGEAEAGELAANAAPEAGLAADEPSADQSQSDQPAVIARVVNKIDCLLGHDAWQLGTDGDVLAGQTLSLERGFMEVRMNNGVSVFLEGPVSFTAVDQLTGILEHGGVGVRVPEGFSGYVVDTPSARVVDLGTEFAVRVNRNGATDLRVIEGEVSVSERSRDGRLIGDEPALLKKDAVWTSLAGLKRPLGAPKASDFPDSQLLRDPEPAHPAAPPVADGLLVWLAADRATKTDGAGGVVAWGDLSSTDTGQRYSAWQVERDRRPVLSPNSIGDLPAIHFDGDDDCLITEPFESSNQQTVVVVSRLTGRRGRVVGTKGFQIINYNGPPNVVLEYRWPLNAGCRPCARAFGGYNRDPWASGWVNAQRVVPQEPTALVYTYDHKADVAALYLNGELQGVARASLPILNRRPKVLGLHRELDRNGFMGDIAELMIIDRVVTAAEIEELFAYLEERYGQF